MLNQKKIKFGHNLHCVYWLLAEALKMWYKKLLNAPNGSIKSNIITAPLPKITSSFIVSDWSTLIPQNRVLFLRDHLDIYDISLENILQ